jgi:molecular chaperone GrpE
MTNTHAEPEEDKVGAEPAAGVEAIGDRPPSAEAGEPSALETRIAQLESQIADLTDRLLRAHAEMDNMRKRAEKERSETAKYAISKFAQDIVTVADNFERAVAAVPPGAAEQDVALKSLVDGVSMTEREFLNVLERHGVRRIEPRGELFNPHLHQAVIEQHNADVPAGTVLQVFQVGYEIEERVLRPAMVAVAKGGPKPAKGGAAAGVEPPPPTSAQSNSRPAEAESGDGTDQKRP